jgi:hypothetical protein
MANPTNPFSWQMPTSTDLVTDLPADFEVFGQAVATSMADLLGGTTGQLLTKASNTDMDFTWTSVAGGGKLKQVVQTVKSDTFTSTSTSFVDIDSLTLSITPTLTTSKILVLYSVVGASSATTSNSIASIRLMRNSTAIGIADAAGSRQRATGGISTRETNATTINFTAAGQFLDSPATTSATTYKIQGITGGGTFFINRNENDSDAAAQYRTISTITAMEIGA